MSGRLEQHLNDISVALHGIGFTLGAIATVLRFYALSQKAKTRSRAPCTRALASRTPADA